jgi:hypothetical protein
VLMTELGCHHHDSGPILETPFWLSCLDFFLWVEILDIIEYYKVK